MRTILSILKHKRFDIISCIRLYKVEISFWYCGSHEALAYSSLGWTMLVQAVSRTAQGTYVKRLIPALSVPNWSTQVLRGTHTTKKDISTLERVQRKAARFCLQNFNKTTSVTDMLSDLKWDTLETRKKKNRLTLMYKLSHN